MEPTHSISVGGGTRDEHQKGVSAKVVGAREYFVPRRAHRRSQSNNAPRCYLCRVSTDLHRGISPDALLLHLTLKGSQASALALIIGYSPSLMSRACAAVSLPLPQVSLSHDHTRIMLVQNEPVKQFAHINLRWSDERPWAFWECACLPWLIWGFFILFSVIFW
jgi:hypothetical protein